MKIAYIKGSGLPQAGVTADRYLNADYFGSALNCDEVILCGELPDIASAYKDAKNRKGVNIKVTQLKPSEKAATKV